MQNSSLNQLLIITFIIVIFSGGKYASHATDAQSNELSQICYESRNDHYCIDLRTANNVTLVKRKTSDDPNLIFNVGNVTWLDLSENYISQIRFQTLGTVEIQTSFISSSSKNVCYENLSSLKYECKYFKSKYPDDIFSADSRCDLTENLQTLILSQNNLKNLSGVFTFLHNLQYLDLSHNLIDELKDDVFTSSKKIVTLKLDNNLIESLSKETFEPFRNLQSLDLSSNRLTGLNLDIFEYLTNLLVLRINDNYNFSSDVTTMEESSGFIFSTGQKFEKLEMAGTSLSKIPIVLTRSIRELDLSNNSLRSIQCGDLDSYPLLQRLILQNNLLKVVEEDSLGRLECLIELNLHGNSLRNIPLSLPWTLQTLNLGYNLLESIDGTDFKGLGHLRTLILRNNKIERISEFAFSQTIRLELLDLSSNPIKLLTSMIFAGPKSLTNLQLENLHQLKCEDDPACNRTFPLTELERLEVLNLESSALLRQQLIADQSVLLTLKHLKQLNLMDTNLTELSPNLLNHLRGLQKLDVHRNPFNCSKNMHWFKEWLQNLKRTYSEDKKLEAVRHRNDSYLSVRIFFSKKEDSKTTPIAQTSLLSDRSWVPRCHTPTTLRGKYILDLPDDKLEVKKMTPKHLIDGQKNTSIERDRNEQGQGSIQQNASVFKPTKTFMSSSERTQSEEIQVPSQDTKNYNTQGLLQNNVADKLKESSLVTGLTDAKSTVNDDIAFKKQVEKEKPLEMKHKSQPVESDLVLPQPVDESNRVNISSLDEPDTFKPVQNSILMNKDNSYDEVSYMNDAPEGGMGINRVKVRHFTGGSNPSARTLMSGSNDDQTNEASTHKSIDSMQNDSVRNTTSAELDKTRIMKHEVKSINKTHIEFSRAGQRNKQMNSTAKATKVSDTQLVRPGDECEQKNNEQLSGSISAKTVSLTNQSTNSQNSLKLQNTTDIGPLVIEPCDVMNRSTSSIEITMSLDSTTSSLAFQSIETTTTPHRQELNNSTMLKTIETVGKASTVSGTSTVNSSSRRKSVRKMKNVEMPTLETVTSSRKFREGKTTPGLSNEPGTTERNAEIATGSYETTTRNSDTIQSQKHKTVKNERQDKAIFRSPEVKDEDMSLNSTQENKEPKDGSKTNKIGRKNDKKTKQSKLLVIVPTVDNYDGKHIGEVTEKSSRSKQNNSEAGHKNNYAKKNRNNTEEEIKIVKNSESNVQRNTITILGTITTESIGDEKFGTEKDKNNDNYYENSYKGSENRQTIKNKGVNNTEDEHQKNKLDLSGKISKTRRRKNEDTDRKNGSVGSKNTTSSPDLQPIQEALGGVTHNSSDKILIYAANIIKAVDNKSSAKSAVNTNKYNSNLERIKDDQDKGGGGGGNGSHPGMLIFLLVISVLLFTLSLMLISHWTWCRQLNSMYELSADRQILGEAESDFEINSLTNFKDHERW